MYTQQHVFMSPTYYMSFLSISRSHFHKLLDQYENEKFRSNITNMSSCPLPWSRSIVVHFGQGPAFRERLYSFIMYNLGCTSFK